MYVSRPNTIVCAAILEQDWLQKIKYSKCLAARQRRFPFVLLVVQLERKSA